MLKITHLIISGGGLLYYNHIPAASRVLSRIAFNLIDFKARDTRCLLLTGRKVITLVIFDSDWWHFITAHLPMNLQARLYLCSSFSFWVMLQIVLKRKFFIKGPLSHQLPYIKLLFNMHAFYYTDVQNIQ